MTLSLSLTSAYVDLLPGLPPVPLSKLRSGYPVRRTNHMAVWTVLFKFDCPI